MPSEDVTISDVEGMCPTPPPAKEESYGALEHDLSPEEQRKTLRKIDIRVTGVLGIIHCMSLMDRGNLGVAAVIGMNDELDLNVDNRYSVVALIFFVPYLIFEFISTLLARSIGTRRLLMTVCVLWGIIMIGTGFVRNWKQLAGLRVMLGVCEAAFIPVVVHMLSAWYTRDEVQKRYALFFFVTVLITSFTGVLAYGFKHMQGLGGISGWRWTFIMEGIMTVVFGLVATFFVVEFPDKARSSFRFLSDRQINWAIYRLQQDRGDVDTEPFSWGKFFRAGRHFPIWLYGIIICCNTLIVTCVSIFLPIILHRDMGFSEGASICLVTPPYIFASLMMFMCGWIGDKYGRRGPILIVNSIIAIVGLVMLGWTKPSSVRYLSIFIINSGMLANIPTVLAYQANNLRGQWIRAFGSAILVVGGAMGGVFGSLVFRKGDPTSSKAGIGVCIAANVATILTVLGLTAFFVRENRLARQGRKFIHDHSGFSYSL